MSFKFRRAAQPSFSNEDAGTGINQFAPGSVTGAPAIDDEGRAHVRPETEEEIHDVQVEIDSARSKADALHAARDAIGGQECDRAMESFLVESALLDPYASEGFSVESIDLMGDRSPVPGALDREIAATERKVRELRELTY